MPEPKRILVVVGTRPEVIKLAPVVAALRREPWADVRLVATAQHRELLDGALAFFGLRPDVDLDLMRADQSLSELTARLLAAIDPVLVAQAPQLVLAQGDTTTVLATALACFQRRVPFAHVEAGLRTLDPHCPFPEEMNRVLVARLASLHFAPTTAARDHLLREGVEAAAVHVTGNTAIDALLETAARVQPRTFDSSRGQHLLLVTAHRRESFGAPFTAICTALRSLADRPDVQILMPLHPNPKVRAVATELLGDHASIDLVAPLDHADVVAAMQACTLILTDSGGIQEEAPSLGKPVLVLRTKTERPEGIAAGVARLVGTDSHAIVAAASELLDDANALAAMARVRNPYGDGRAAARITGAVSTFLHS